MRAWTLITLVSRCWLVAGFLAVRGAAHDGPEDEVGELTELIEKGETPELLVRRAIEYRVMGKNTEASHDLERATRMNPASLFAQRELGRVYFALGKTNEAIDTLSHALKIKGEEPTEIASLRILRAEFYRARSENKKALEDSEEAIRLHPQNVEWYLLRSDLQERLKLPKERIKGIENGVRETGAGILEIELVEAFLDDKQYETALIKIEQELKDSRIQGSWLLRRARAKMGQGDKKAATLDLEAALEEINPRLTAGSVDASLLTDKAQAHDLLGEKIEARRYYEQARDAGADEWVKERIKAIKAEEDAREKEKEKVLDKERGLVDEDKPDKPEKESKAERKQKAKDKL